MKWLLILFFPVIIMVESCKNKSMQTENPEDKIQYMDSLMASPIAAEESWRPGDQVAIIDTAENFKTVCEIEKEAFNVCLYYTGYAKIKEYKWLSPDELTQYEGYLKGVNPVKCMPHAFKVRINTGRLARTEWIAADKIFPVPWRNNKQLKINDTVYIKRFGNFESYKGIILDTPDKPGYQFVVSYDGYTGKSLVDYKDVYSSIQPVKSTDLKPGTILYFQNMYWVMIMGLQDEDHAIVREEGFPARDKIVPINTLQILK